MVIGAIGIALIAFACAWWHAFYTQVAHAVGSKGQLPTQCLYSSEGMCGLFGGIGGLLGAHPYHPWVLWLGSGMVAVAVLIDLPIWPQRVQIVNHYHFHSDVSKMGYADAPGQEKAPEFYQANAYPKGWHGETESQKP